MNEGILNCVVFIIQCIFLCFFFNFRVTVRRPVPVPFPAHNIIDQSTILYFISRVLLVWKH